VFLKARNPQTLAAWYATQLGILTEEGGSLVFSGPKSAGMTVFAHFPEDTGYFGDGEQQVMVNFRVDDLDGLLVQLVAAGVRVDPKTRGLSLRAIRMDLGSGRQPRGTLAAAARGVKPIRRAQQIAPLEQVELRLLPASETSVVLSLPASQHSMARPVYDFAAERSA
jgi:hypothetical protein